MEKFFKNAPRLLDAFEFQEAYAEGKVLKVISTAGDIAGVLVWDATPDAVSFGPLAVRPEYHGKGYGKVLINELYSIARKRGVNTVQMRVVNLRTELFDFYEKMGFERYGVADYPHPERLTQPCHFFLYKKTLESLN